ncbi:hypothetical protein [Glycomyces buryatensis]|uniref:Uncharacterized protein n=1 Tax=Glycomyces buryatensis TaxID=2570927 RepID=A0A4S8QDE4_9ACTN|nr:hypothetical protein [Glycomyces buryatensis]THV42563.1 hypothetical protein FAB82_05150 [Glycomyces buryatensis]
MSAIESRPDRTGWFRWILRRWPTGLALVAAFLVLGSGVSAETQSSLAELIPLLSLEYLLIAALGRRRLSWPVVFALSAVMTALQIIGLVRPSLVFAVLALAALVWGAIDRRLLRDGMFRLQALGMLGFGALALVAFTVDADLARYVIAAAWLAHGAWDIVHHRLDRVVSRSYAEACGVLDVLIAAGLIFLV